MLYSSTGPVDSEKSSKSVGCTVVKSGMTSPKISATCAASCSEHWKIEKLRLRLPQLWIFSRPSSDSILLHPFSHRPLFIQYPSFSRNPLPEIRAEFGGRKTHSWPLFPLLQQLFAPEGTQSKRQVNSGGTNLISLIWVQACVPSRLVLEGSCFPERGPHTLRVMVCVPLIRP